ncbi:MAG: ribosomal-processing cysteine protease Prp [Firmicutes bacterium]|nr:ribosomal-processing cysteine protease Prp [Bacillota bacterium]
MTKVQMIRANGRFIGFKAKGHTGYAAAGKDIVCAGVSTLVQTPVLGFEKLVGLKLHLEKERKSGYLACYLPSALDQEQLAQADLLLNLMYLGLQQIASGYQKYVGISIKEVEKSEV